MVPAQFSLLFLLVLCPATQLLAQARNDDVQAPPALRVATFRCDVTPPVGHWLYAMPIKTIEHPLLAKGVVLEQDSQRYVLCAIDWCVLANSSHALLRQAMASAAGTEPDKVVLQCTHVHTSVIIDADAKQLLSQANDPPAYYDPEFLTGVAARLGTAVRESLVRSGNVRSDRDCASSCGSSRVGSPHQRGWGHSLARQFGRQ